MQFLQKEWVENQPDKEPKKAPPRLTLRSALTIHHYSQFYCQIVMWSYIMVFDILYCILVQLCPSWDVVIHHKKVKLLSVSLLKLAHCRKQHTTGLDAHHRSRWEIGNGDQGLSNQFLWLIKCMNTRKNRPVFT